MSSNMLEVDSRIDAHSQVDSDEYKGIFYLLFVSH